MVYEKHSVETIGRKKPSSEAFSRKRMELLPREHGATAIWFSSLLLALGSLREPPSPLRALGFLAVAVLTLIFIAKLTSNSKSIARSERNSTLLPLFSGLVTLVAPLGQIMMTGWLSISGLATWLVFLAYCSTAAVYTRGLVRSVLRGTPAAWTAFIISAVLLVVEAVLLNMIAWLSIAAVAVVVPLIAHRIVVPRLAQREGLSRMSRIRIVGFAQAGSLLAATVILILVSRL